MKRLIHLHTLLIVALLLSAGACKKELDTRPSNAVPARDLFKNTTGIETVLNGTWSYMNDTYSTYANPGYSSILRTSDAMGQRHRSFNN